MSYYDIDAILNDGQKLPCTVDIDCPGMGFLESTSASIDLKQGTRLQLPLWLAELLTVSEKLGLTNDIVSIDVPPSLTPRVLNALKANPKYVELRQFGTHFYALGERMLDLFEDEDLREIMIATYKTRVAEIADLAHNPQGAIGGESGVFLRGLDERERNLFKVAHDSSKAIKHFMEDVKK